MLAAMLFLFMIGLSVRVFAVLATAELKVRHFEPINIAQSLIQDGAYANAYGPGTGPTAHCAPLHPLLVAGLMRIFGSPQRFQLPLSIFACASVALGYALLVPLSVICGFGVRVGLFGGLSGALLPVTFWHQTAGLFDAPFTFLSITALTCLFARWSMRGSLTITDGLMLGIVGAASVLLNPVSAVVIVVCITLNVWQCRSGLQQYVPALATLLLALVLPLLPWGIRNQRALGAFIVTRSNFGLELKVSNNDVVTADLETNIHEPAWQALHPLTSAAEREQLRRLGEVAYHAAKRREATDWILQHPTKFMNLSLSRLALFWFPVMARPWQTMLQALFSIFGLLGLSSLFVRHHRCASLFAVILASYPLVYYIIQASPRYRFPIEGLLLFLGATLAFGIWSRIGPSSNTTTIRSRPGVWALLHLRQSHAAPRSY